MASNISICERIQNQQIFLGMEECVVRNNNNNNKEMVKSRSQSTSLAEEAVDQLQASEKLIAGK